MCLGCILGPPLARFLPLPLFSQRCVLFLFAAPWLFLGASTLLTETVKRRPRGHPLLPLFSWR
jgi:hypothetical protein